MIETSCELNSRDCCLLCWSSIYLFLSCAYFGALLSILLSQPCLLKPIATASHDSTSRRSFPGEGAWDRRAFRHDEWDRRSMIKDADRSVGATISHRVSQEQRTRVRRATKNVMYSLQKKYTR